MAFYEFARTADDVADHPDLTPTEKFALLDEMEETLLGRLDSQREAIALREALAERNLDRRHAQDMLRAFRLDVTRRRYRSWNDLIDYCGCSAMPVGRFVLDVHGEPHSTWPASDALCAALQVINHLQDCGDDYRKLNRVYLPLDIVVFNKAEIEALSAENSTPELRCVFDDLCGRADDLLVRSAGLAGQVRSNRLGFEIAVIHALAKSLVERLRKGDPLNDEMHLSRLAAARIATGGAVGGGMRRIVPASLPKEFQVGIPWPAIGKAGGKKAMREETASRPASGSSFYAAMRILPARRREAIFEIYAFCRAVDDIADEGGDRRSRADGLEAWRERIVALYGAHPVKGSEGLALAVSEFGLQQEDFLAVIDGMAMDVDADICAPSAEVLDLYCDRVASAVGRLCVRVFGMEFRPGIELAHHLGRALQLTNILRDLDEDAGLARLYLPREVLDEAGITASDPKTVLAHPNLDAACRTVASEALAHFEKAESIMAASPRSPVRAPRIMASVYRAILAMLVTRGWAPPRRRVRLGRMQLGVIALRSMVS